MQVYWHENRCGPVAAQFQLTKPAQVSRPRLSGVSGDLSFDLTSVVPAMDTHPSDSAFCPEPESVSTTINYTPRLTPVPGTFIFGETRAVCGMKQQLRVLNDR